mgnify:CR=1 FL=1
MSDPVYITLREAARRYSCSTRTLRRRIAAGKLPAVYASARLIRVREDHVSQLFKTVPAVAA